MQSITVLFIASALVFRFGTLGVSIRNERRLKARGAREFGAANSILLALLHILFYAAAIVEWAYSGTTGLTAVQAGGMALYLFAAVMLVIIIRTLHPFWTVKIIIASDHRLVRRGPFRWFRHPNYFLNILPELVGFAVALQAYATLIVGLPVYLVCLYVRIRQEEAAMRSTFPDYGRPAGSGDLAGA
ncbi:isoprenylcysteine carboxyl methyltransferase family protein [Nitratireductor thuwali]|uniref:Isoprenylcysteine carboxyl methyltransferase n=1 Tax=Nitratireductor thuwali TaxID=2267699 RepID=A0ABY5ML65_9HYPH|nr:hypothetical protein NTH_03045 [Nitratireductor thuwali]